MARQPRFFVPGLTQHVIQRGNNRGAMFREAVDYEMFLLSIAEASLKYDIDVHAYVLMTTHVHLMITPGSATAIPKAMQCIGRRYVLYFNRMYGRTGCLWEGRYKAWMLDDERYWLTCLRYIEQNPVRAGMVSSPDQYRWSSYHAHAGDGRPSFLTPHPLYLGLGATSRERQAAWRTICGGTMSDQELSETRQRIRGATPGTSAGWG